MAYRKWLCTRSCFTGGILYEKGLVYMSPEDPLVGYFVAHQGEEYTPLHEGFIDLDGTWYPGPIGWDDWRFALDPGRRGALDKPDYDYNDLGLAFPQNDATEIAYMSEIAPHSLLLSDGVEWHPHIHFLQDEAELPTFYYQMRITAVGQVAGAFSTAAATTGDPVIEYVSGKIHQILEFPAIRPVEMGAINIAALVDIKLWRDDNDVAGDVIAKEFDIHVPSDAPLGSGQQFIK